MDNSLLLHNYWNQLYPELSSNKLDDFLSSLKKQESVNQVDDWYKDAIVYALYVDLYNVDFNGLTEKLDYIQNLANFHQHRYRQPHHPHENCILLHTGK